jgi:hypothetical protein
VEAVDEADTVVAEAAADSAVVVDADEAQIAVDAMIAVDAIGK